MKQKKLHWLTLFCLLIVFSLFLFGAFSQVIAHRKYVTHLSSLAQQTKQEKVEATTISEEETSVANQVSPEKTQEKIPESVREPTVIDGIILVNKDHPLPATYHPGEDEEAVLAFLSMMTEMQQLGLQIASSYSGFRSYEAQTQLFASYAAQDGENAAASYSARPGYSEHQTGLAFDFIHLSGELVQTSEEAQWIADNAFRYGFIVRYQEGKEDITGHIAEPWHVRYVGMKAANIIKEKQWTLEEYLGVVSKNE